MSIWDEELMKASHNLRDITTWKFRSRSDKLYLPSNSFPCNQGASLFLIKRVKENLPTICLTRVLGNFVIAQVTVTVQQLFTCVHGNVID